MTNETEDTPWAISKKGNTWRRFCCYVLTIGISQYGIWVRVDKDFLKGPFPSSDEAKQAAEKAVLTLPNQEGLTGTYWDIA